MHALQGLGRKLPQDPFRSPVLLSVVLCRSVVCSLCAVTLHNAHWWMLSHLAQEKTQSLSLSQEQFVAQLAELRTKNQQLHQALQQVQQQQSQQQQQQSQQQSLIQALSDLPQSLAQTVGSAVLAAANPARTNPTLVDTKGLGKPSPLKNTESECAPWS